MALTDGTLNLMGTYLAGLITHLSLHSADPGSTGTSEVSGSGGRQAVAFTVDADGDLTMTGTETFTGLAANQTVTHVGYWSAITAGTFRGSQALTGDTTANSAGEYTVTALTITGTST